MTGLNPLQILGHRLLWLSLWLCRVPRLESSVFICATKARAGSAVLNLFLAAGPLCKPDLTGNESRQIQTRAAPVVGGVWSSAHRPQCGGCPPAGRHSPPLPALAVCGLNGRRRTAGPEGEQATVGLSHSRLPTCHLPGTSTGPAASRPRGAFHAFCLLTSAIRGVHHYFHLRGG